MCGAQATNAVYIFESRGQVVAECRSTQNVALRGGNMVSASMPKIPGVAAFTSQVLFSLPQLRGSMALGTVMVAMGVADAEAMVAACTHGRLETAGADLLALEAKRADFSPEGRARAEAAVQAAWMRGETTDVREYIMREIVPHVATLEHKARFLGYMVWRMLAVRDGLLEPDDRDDYVNKRIDLGGVLMAQLFRQLYKRFRGELRNNLCKAVEKFPVQGLRAVAPRNVPAANSDLASKGFRFSLSTGTWAVQGTPSARQCVSQVLNRLNYYATLSHLRRINSPAGREGKLTQPRQIHNTMWGLICPAESPEGQTVGLVKNMAILAHVTVGYEEELLTDLIGHLVEDGGAVHGKLPVLVNGTHLGRASADIVQEIRRLRRNGALSWETSVVYVPQDDAIHVHTDGGRLTRPLLIVEPDGSVPAVGAAARARRESGVTGLELDVLTTTGVVDYLDVLEQAGSLIALNPGMIQAGETTHCEVHPSSILGVTGSLIPLPHCNQSPR